MMGLELSRSFFFNLNFLSLPKTINTDWLNKEICTYGKENNQEHFKRIKSLKTKSLALLPFEWGYLTLNLFGSTHAHAIKLHKILLKMWTALWLKLFERDFSNYCFFLSTNCVNSKRMIKIDEKHDNKRISLTKEVKIVIIHNNNTDNKH